MTKKANTSNSKFLFFLFFCTVSPLIWSQNKEQAQLIDAYIIQNERLIFNLKSDEVRKNIADSYKNTKLLQDKVALKLTNTLLEASIHSGNWQIKKELVLRMIKSVIREAEQHQERSLKLFAELRLAFYMYNYGDYKASLPYFLSVLKTIEKNEDIYIIDEADTYTKLGYFLSYLNECNKASDYLIKAIELLPKDTPKQAQLHFNLGQFQNSQGNIDQANAYFQEALSISKRVNDEVTEAKVYGEQASILFNNHQQEEAIQLLKKDISLSKKNKANRNTLYALMSLGRMYLQMDSIGSLSQIITAILNQQKIDKINYSSFEYDILQLRKELALKRGDKDLELQLRRKIETVYNQRKHNESEEAIKEMNWEIQKVEFALETQKKDNILEHTKNRNRLLFTSLSFLFILSTLFVVIRKRKLEKKTLNNQLIQIISKYKEDKFIFEKNTRSYHQFITENHQLVTNLKNEIKNIQSEFVDFQKANTNKEDEFAAFFTTHLKTEEAWIEFKKIFRKKYPDYMDRLISINVPLTEGNIRFILLLKIGYSDNEIAELTSVTLGAVKKSRQRLQQKLGDKYEMLFI
jgi:tetratricopeptide (TPR) repeat protein